ncbi:flagellar biosynthesis anti-sigma factor FlgM [Pseudodesulfovibrio sp. F-1]|uniref:Flagellar biosynthesis anti-sigma factor FlgM n=1 Tax=Pseudodesulfovibrio alkaliphilus TaxID=2661613 RepID=A0A7K1KKU7_9BACT|nr:flagellar biosynthesis anti-sigma factor FlgM [Pseudodesulfovibrio alkaliphilus]MUM76699.1 flagellar biosynthesis anti-sigma factor FlgM [Pseudodesulfovibrio alkaliphilus]
MKRQESGGCAVEIETERVLREFDAARGERPERCRLSHSEEAQRAEKIARLKSLVRSGDYRPDIKDIARLLTSAMDPTP